MAGNGAKPFRIDSIPNEVSLYPVWKFHNGDNAQWAAPSYDDNSWDTIYSDMQKEADQKKFTGIGWFRLHLKVSPALFHRKFVFSMEQAGASEVYLNGKRIFQFGTVSGTGHEVAFSPRTSTYFIEFGGDSNQVIVVRYSAWKAMLKNYFRPGFTITLEDTDVAMATLKSKETTLMWSYLFFAMFFTLAQNVFDRLATFGSDFRWCVHFCQTIQRCTNHVVRIGRTVGLCHHVRHTHYFKNCAHWATGDNASTFFRWRHQH